MPEIPGIFHKQEIKEWALHNNRGEWWKRWSNALNCVSWIEVEVEVEVEAEKIEKKNIEISSLFLIFPLNNLKSPRVMRNVMTMLILE